MSLAPAFQHRNLPQQVADHIVLLIAAGEYQPGDRLFEKDICERLNVSRIPVREAFRLLQAQGVIRGEPNRGSYITDFGSEETAEMMEMRVVVERIALRHLVKRIKANPEVLDLLRARIEEMHKAIRNSDRLDYCRADLAFHTTLIEQSESPILKPIWDSLSRGILVFLMQERRLESTYEVSIADHERLVALLVARDAAGLEKEIERHIVSYLPGPRAAAKASDGKRRKAG